MIYTNIDLVIKTKYIFGAKKLDKRQINIVRYRSLSGKSKINNSSLTTKNKENE